jgi:hypothetical protein
MWVSELCPYRRDADVPPSTTCPGITLISWSVWFAKAALGWQWRTTRTILHDVDTAPRPSDSTSAASPETEAERQRRAAWEAEGLVRARASIAAGYYATSPEVNAWIDSLGGDNPLPVPYPRHPRRR